MGQGNKTAGAGLIALALCASTATGAGAAPDGTPTGAPAAAAHDDSRLSPDEERRVARTKARQAEAAKITKASAEGRAAPLRTAGGRTAPDPGLRRGTAARTPQRVAAGNDDSTTASPRSQAAAEPSARRRDGFTPHDAAGDGPADRGAALAGYAPQAAPPGGLVEIIEETDRSRSGRVLAKRTFTRILAPVPGRGGGFDGAGGADLQASWTWIDGRRGRMAY